MKKFFIACAMLIASNVTVWADSPLTSTEWAKAYQDVPIVAKMIALNGEAVTTELIEYLANDENPVDVKVAAINAITFNKDAYTPLMNRLKAKLGTQSEISILAKIGASTHVALAYARARHFYNDLREANIVAYSAISKDPDSLTANMVYALILSNFYLDAGQWQYIYPVCNNVKSEASLKQDMRPQAITMLMEYINLYKEYANQAK